MKRLILMIGIAGSLLAGDIELSLEVEERNVFIGDRIRISFHVMAPETVKVRLPDAAAQIRDLEILERKDHSGTGRGMQTLRMDLEATAFDTGFVHIPPLPLICGHPADPGKGDTLYFPEKYIYIRSTLDTSAAPAAMKAPLRLSLMTWWEYLVTAVLLLAAALILFLGLRKRQHGSGEAKKTWTSPAEQAKRAILELEEKRYPERREWKHYYLELSYLLREYFENLYFLHLQELSTSEMLPVLKPRVLPEHYEDLCAFFRFADRVKFARSPADAGRCMKDLDLVKRIIEEDRIQRDGSPENNRKQ